MNFSNFSNMKIIGPGLWFDIHVQAIKATTDMLKNAFIININNLQQNMRCGECQTHFAQHLLKHPLLPYWNIPDGFFVWSWNFHNAVNIRLGKPFVPYNEAYEFYSNSSLGICTNCGDNNPPILSLSSNSSKSSKYLVPLTPLTPR